MSEQKPVHTQKKATKKPKMAVLQLKVPRTDARGPLAFEQVLASLHGLLGGQTRRQAEERVSFEIVKHDRFVHFYIVVPRHLRTLISSQMFSAYPDVQIDEVPDYLTKKFIKGKKILVSEVKLKNPEVFPIKRHSQFVDSNNKVFEDPLGPITSAISHLFSRDDHAALQIVVKPIPKSWNSVTEKHVKKLFGGGIWNWDWFADLYVKKRFAHNVSGRRKSFLVWKSMEAAGKLFGKRKKVGQTEEDEQEGLSREEKMNLRHDRESVYGGVYDKITRLGFEINMRAIYAHSDPDPLHAEAKIREIMGTLEQFSLPQSNALKIKGLEREKGEGFKKFVKREVKNGFALSQEELATVYHLPTESVTSPAINWVESPRLEPPASMPNEKEAEITIIGQTNFRNMNEKYGIKEEDRLRHVYVIGKTGMGKSTLLENMIESDIRAGKGVGVIDPHGDLAEAVLRFVPKNRTNDVIVFDPSDREYPLAFNMLEGKNKETRGLVASGLVGVIKKMFSDSWGPRLEYFLRNTILALVEAPDTTLLGIQRMLVDPVYQAKILHHVKDPMVLAFWNNEFKKLEPRQRNEAVGPIQNKVGQFLSTPTIRNILGQPKSTLDIRKAMDSGKIVIVNLSKGKIGEDNAGLMGSMLITKFQLDAMSRADTPAKERRPFYLYVDEFQNFATDSFATILSEARKYKLSLTMANQYVAQMSEDVASAVFGNVGSLISFQVGIDDANVFATQFDENRITPIALASLPKYQVYNRIMVDGMTTPVFSGLTLPPPSSGEKDPEARAEKIKTFSRQRYAKPRKDVEDKIARWSKPENEKRRKSGKEESKGEK